MEKPRERQLMDLDVIAAKKAKIKPGVKDFDKNGNTDNREDDPPRLSWIKVLQPGGYFVPKKRRPVGQLGYAPGISAKKWGSLRCQETYDEQEIQDQQRIRDRMDSDPKFGCNFINPPARYQDKQDEGYENQNQGVTKIDWKAKNDFSTQVYAVLPELYPFFAFLEPQKCDYLHLPLRLESPAEGFLWDSPHRPVPEIPTLIWAPVDSPRGVEGINEIGSNS